MENLAIIMRDTAFFVTPCIDVLTPKQIWDLAWKASQQDTLNTLLDFGTAIAGTESETSPKGNPYDVAADSLKSYYGVSDETTDQV